MRKCILSLLFLFSWGFTFAQQNYGTSGLMNMPTADMQRDKTVMAGANWLNKHATVPRWWYDTWNYYINVTFFPWFEVGYVCTGHKAVPTDYGNRSGYWVPDTYGKFINQDRSFQLRLRIWKEGWWKAWTPQVVLGANDAIGDSWNGGSLSKPSEMTYGNGFLNRYYLAVSKHFPVKGLGMIGAHFTWIYGERFDNKLNDPAIGINFLIEKNKGGTFFRRLIGGFNLMAEVLPGFTDVNGDLTFNPDAAKYQVNVGLSYAVWKDAINLIGELNRCKYPSIGVNFKVHLK